jgi:hypothetical protein
MRAGTLDSPYKRKKAETPKKAEKRPPPAPDPMRIDSRARMGDPSGTTFVANESGFPMRSADNAAPLRQR